MLGTDDSAHLERVYISGISPKNLAQEIRKGAAVREAHAGISIGSLGAQQCCLSLRH
jgi:hypothetical protein